MPDGQRAELIDGQFYNMAPPSWIHKEISYQISRLLGNYIESNGGRCRVYPPPFAVNLDADDKDWVEPDISLICDPNKLIDRGCSGAPDLIFEIVSLSSRRMDYIIKNALTPLNLPNKIRRRPLLLFRKTISFLPSSMDFIRNVIFFASIRIVCLPSSSISASPFSQP